MALKDLKNQTELIFNMTFEEFNQIQNRTVNQNLSLKLVYTVVLINQLFVTEEDSPITLIFPIDNSTLELEKLNYFLKKNKLEYLKLPKALVIIFILLLIIFLAAYFMRQKFSKIIFKNFISGNRKIFYEGTKRFRWKSKLVGETFNTLQVKNFILHDEKLSLEVDRFTEQTIYHSYQEYTKFVFQMIPKSKGLREKIKRILKERDEFKVSI